MDKYSVTCTQKTLPLELMDNSFLLLACNIRDMGLKSFVQMMIFG